MMTTPANTKGRQLTKTYCITHYAQKFWLSHNL